MVRIVGVDIPDNKRIEIALTYIYGIGKSRAQEILKNTGVSFDIRASKLTPEQINKIKVYIESHYKIEGELRRTVSANIKRLKEIRTYRGLRHVKKLPVRGQRTKTNSRTIRGNVRKTMTSGRRKLEKK